MQRFPQETASLFPEDDDETSRSGTSAVAFARVAPERALDLTADGLTYGVPESMADLEVGERVVVPLGRGDKPTPGFVIAISTEPGDFDPAKIKLITDRDSRGNRIDPQLVELGQWMSSYLTR